MHEKFTLKNELKYHTEKAHLNDCSECGKNYQSLKFLTNHIRTVHTVQRFCADCSKVFSTKSKLTSHMSNIHAVGEFYVKFVVKSLHERTSSKTTQKKHSRRKQIVNSSRKSDILQIAKIVNKAHEPHAIGADTMANTACNIPHIAMIVNQPHKQHTILEDTEAYTSCNIPHFVKSVNQSHKQHAIRASEQTPRLLC